MTTTLETAQTLPHPTALRTDSLVSAQTAGLRYVSDASQGIRREPDGDGFRYMRGDGKPITNPKELRRIEALGIPPAWQQVWICPRLDGHIQATGRDAKGRKQYRYHERWREVRDETKYGHMIAFAQALPRLRAQVNQDLGLPGLPRRKVLAAVIRLLETTLIRVGNQEYARANRSYGLTTMRDKHVQVCESNIRFQFYGKSGKKHSITLRDRRLARIVRRCRDLPGYDLFQYLDESGQRQTINSADVNSYLRDISGQDVTAKDFRTWAGTVLAAVILGEMGTFETASQAKKNIVQAIEQVAERLGNTPSICRKCYIHPAVLDAYLDCSLVAILQHHVGQELKDCDLRPEEVAIVQLLQQHIGQQANIATLSKLS